MIDFKGNIFDGICGDKPNHAVTAIGWGIQNGVSYWIIRNSYGSSWGDRGHIKIKIGGRCKVFPEFYPFLV
jgi:hypothetical protein